VKTLADHKQEFLQPVRRRTRSSSAASVVSSASGSSAKNLTNSTSVGNLANSIQNLANSVQNLANSQDNSTDKRKGGTAQKFSENSWSTLLSTRTLRSGTTYSGVPSDEAKSRQNRRGQKRGHSWTSEPIPNLTLNSNNNSTNSPTEYKSATGQGQGSKSRGRKRQKSAPQATLTKSSLGGNNGEATTAQQPERLEFIVPKKRARTELYHKPVEPALPHTEGTKPVLPGSSRRKKAGTNEPPELDCLRRSQRNKTTGSCASSRYVSFLYCLQSLRLLLKSWAIHHGTNTEKETVNRLCFKIISLQNRQLFFTMLTRQACAFTSSFLFRSILIGYSFGGQSHKVEDYLNLVHVFHALYIMFGDYFIGC
jgi:hypothetical protein